MLLILLTFPQTSTGHENQLQLLEHSLSASSRLSIAWLPAASDAEEEPDHTITIFIVSEFTHGPLSRGFVVYGIGCCKKNTSDIDTPGTPDYSFVMVPGN